MKYAVYLLAFVFIKYPLLQRLAAVKFYITSPTYAACSFLFNVRRFQATASEASESLIEQISNSKLRLSGYVHSLASPKVFEFREEISSNPSYGVPRQRLVCLERIIRSGIVLRDRGSYIRNKSPPGTVKQTPRRCFVSRESRLVKNHWPKLAPGKPASRYFFFPRSLDCST